MTMLLVFCGGGVMIVAGVTAVYFIMRDRENN
jgi:hypothetical protein